MSGLLAFAVENFGGTVKERRSVARPRGWSGVFGVRGDDILATVTAHKASMASRCIRPDLAVLVAANCPGMLGLQVRASGAALRQAGRDQMLVKQSVLL